LNDYARVLSFTYLHPPKVPAQPSAAHPLSQKDKKKGLLKSNVSKSLISSVFADILLSVRIVSFYQSRSLYFVLHAKYLDN